MVLRLAEPVVLFSDSTLEVTPGSTTTHEFTLLNRSGQTDSFNLAISGNNWPTTLLSSTPITVSNQATVTIPVSVTVPTIPFETDVFTLTATSPTTAVLQVQGTTHSAVNPGIVLTPRTDALFAEVGTAVTHTIHLTNTGNYTDTFNIEIQLNDWQTEAPTSTVPLGVGEAIDLEIVVTIPTLLERGDDPPVATSDRFKLWARSSYDEEIFARYNGTTNAIAHAGLLVNGTLSRTGVVSESVIYSLTVTNTGNYTDTFVVTVGDSNWPLSLPVTTTNELGIGDSQQINVHITVGEGEIDTVLVTFTSSLDSMITDEVMLTTTAVSPRTDLFLPLLIR